MSSKSIFYQIVGIIDNNFSDGVTSWICQERVGMVGGESTETYRNTWVAKHKHSLEIHILIFKSMYKIYIIILDFSIHLPDGLDGVLRRVFMSFMSFILWI